MTTMRYRRLDANHDTTFGAGQNNYLTDIYAVAQAIDTRLLLFLSEWWEDQGDGLPLWQSILGARGAVKNKKKIDLIIQNRILGTLNVTGIVNLVSTYTPDTRIYTFQASVNTLFGVIVVNNFPNAFTIGGPP